MMLIKAVRDRSWYRIQAKGTSEADVYIYDEIGLWGIKAEEFVKDINALAVDRINLRLNTPGGGVFDGFAIYNALRSHRAEVITHIDGLAASIGSVVALAGDTVNIAQNAFFMIHNPHALVLGESKDMRKMADTLDKIAGAIVRTYADKSGKSEEEIQQIMNKETWFNADEAKEAGFADNVTETREVKARFDLSAFARVPKELIESVSHDTPTERELERTLREAGGLSRAAAKAVMARGYKALSGDRREAGAGGQREADVGENTTAKGGKKEMNKCIHCGTELAEGAICQCEGARAARTAGQIDVKAATIKAAEEAGKAERERVSEIMAIAEAHDCAELGRQYIQGGQTMDEFRAAVLEQKYKGTPVTQSPEIGMSAKEKNRFSIVRVINAISEFKPLDGLEKEASDAVAKICGRQPKGFFIPYDVMTYDIRADLSAGDATKGGYTIGTEVLAGSMIELLRNKMLISRLGATQLGGLIGNITIPRVTGGGTAYWLPETGAVTKSDQAFGQLGLTPHKLAADTAYSKELVMQSSIDVEAFVRNDLMRVLAIEKDRAALDGSGSAGEPVGILNTTGIKTVTFGGAATWANVVDFETQIADANADVDAMSYLTTPAVRGKWKTAVKVTNQAVFLWERGSERGVGEVNGYPAYATKQVPSDKVVFGNWADLIIADWAGVDVVVDPYSLKKNGQIEVTINMWTDIGVRHAVSFCASTDSGAQ